MSQCMIAEFEAEAPATRRFLERIPEDKLTWKPHEKSLTAGQLGLHLANIPHEICAMGAVNPSPMPDFAEGFPQPESLQQILDTHDTAGAIVTNTLSALSDDQLAEDWSITDGSNTLLTMPRVAFFRTVLLNHAYHHRGQLGIYLRLLGQKVPSAFGPSADEIPDYFAPVVEAMQAMHANA